MAARTRCSPAVSRYPPASASFPSFSCTAARALHAAHQSSQRSSARVTSSKSASSTPFETKRGAQWAIAAATRGSEDLAFAAASDIRLPRLQGPDQYLAELHDAGVLHGVLAMLQRQHPAHVPAVAHVRGLDSIQHHDHAVALHGDVVDIPPAAGLGHGRDLRHADDGPGAVARIGTLVEDIDLVGGGAADLPGIGAADVDAAVRLFAHPELGVKLEVGVGLLRDEQAVAAVGD